MNRKTFERINGIYEYSILGSGDHIMSLSFIGKGEYGINGMVADNYKKSVELYQKNCKLIRLGYVPGTIRHFYHGTKANRKYNDRWKILVNHKFDPFNHITKDDNGILIPTNICPKELLDDIINYFLR
jgi:hypothetical protein